MKKLSPAAITFATLLLLLLAHQPAAAYYDPGLQRWLNRDPIQEAGGVNLFQFVGNGPEDDIDPFGRQPQPAPPKPKPKKPHPKNKSCPDLECQWPKSGGSVGDIPDVGGFDGAPGSGEVCKKFDCAVALKTCRDGCDAEYGLGAAEEQPNCLKACKQDCKQHHSECEKK